MKILIAEDDWVSRKFLHEFLKNYGICDLTVDGMEVVDAFIQAWEDGEPYELICLDIMMPKIDGLKALKAIRDIETQKGIRDDERVNIIMVSALSDTNNVFKAFATGCEAYITKPIDTKKLIDIMKDFKLIN